MKVLNGYRELLWIKSCNGHDLYYLLSTYDKGEKSDKIAVDKLEEVGGECQIIVAFISWATRVFSRSETAL